MTLKVAYTHVCDTCCAEFDSQVYVLPSHGEIPRPSRQYVVNGHTLCKECTEVAVEALNKALEPRRRKESE